MRYTPLGMAFRVEGYVRRDDCMERCYDVAILKLYKQWVCSYTVHYCQLARTKEESLLLCLNTTLCDYYAALLYNVIDY